MTAAKGGQQHDRTALVLYGSETGNSQEVAEELGRITQRLRFWTKVCEMDQVDLKSLLVPTIVLFAVGTTGQGEFPRNARKLWKSLLRKRLPPGCLTHVNFTTFGLGDSSYTKYNFAVRKLHKRIEQLGAKEVYPRGEADERHEDGVDGTFLSWAADLRKHLLSSYPLPPGLTEIPAEDLLPPTHTLAIHLGPSDAIESRSSADQNHLTTPNNIYSEAVKFYNNQARSLARLLITSATNNPETLTNPPNMRTNWAPDPEYELDTRSQLKEGADDLASAHAESEFPPHYMLPISRSIEAKLIMNKRVTPQSHWQDVRLLTFDVPASKEYHPGDCVTIYPKNFPQDVQTLLDLQGWNDVADMPLVFRAQAPDYFTAENLVSPLPPGLKAFQDTTLRELLTHNLDFTSIPKRNFFNLIANFTDDLRHRERLLDFTNPMFTDEFYDYATRPRRSILEVLQEFSSVRLPWKWVTTLFPPIRGRQFSICSGGLQQDYSPGNDKITVQLLVAIVRYKTVLRKVRQGLCSRYIAGLPAGTTIAITMQPNLTFSKAVEKSVGRPVMMVGPGTGVAPCRSLIWERATDALDSPEQARDMLLFFGNRNKDADFFFEKEWKIPTLRTEVFTAFSRDQREKIYVQDLIRKEGRLVHQLIKENALILVCGSSGKMPQSVKQAFIDVMKEHGGPWESSEKVEEAFALIEKSGRYLQETW